MKNKPVSVFYVELNQQISILRAAGLYFNMAMLLKKISMITVLNLHSSRDEVKEKLKEVNTEFTANNLEYDSNDATQLIQDFSVKMKKSEEDVKA